LAEPVPFRFRAFLSYCHRDGSWAKWLHAGLEGYRVDKDLVGRKTPAGPVPKTLAPIFRDRDDFSAGHSLTEQTEAALEGSQFMVVLCSPDAAKSIYVNEEIRRFKALGRGDRVIPLIIAGEPGDPVAECFPPALRFKIDAAGALTQEHEEPIAADARPQGDGKALARLKLIAGLLGVGFDEIIRRAERARRRRNRIWATIAASFVFLAAATTGSAVYAYNKLIESDENLDQAIGSASRIVSDVAGKADRFGVPIDMQMTLLRYASSTLDGLIMAGRNTPTLRHRRALMLMSFADNYARLGETTPALANAQEAQSMLAALTAETARADWQHDLALADYGLADILIDRGVLADALGNLQSAVTLLTMLVAAAPEQNGWQLDLARAHEKLGYVRSDRGSLGEALASFRQAQALATKLVAQEPANVEAEQLQSFANERIGGVLQSQGSLAMALSSFRDSLAIMERLAAADPDNTRWQRRLITLYRDFGNALRAKGSLADAQASLQKGIAIARRLTQSDPKNAVWQRELATSQLIVGDLRKDERNLPEALATYRDGLAVMQRLATADPRNTLFQRDLSLCHDRVGAVLEAQGNIADAYQSYLASLKISQTLAASDPSNTVWQRDLAIADRDVGDRLVKSQKPDNALNAYKIAIDILAALLRADGSNSLWQRDMAATVARLGTLMRGQNDAPQALAFYRQSLAMLDRLATADPDNLGLQEEFWRVQDSIAELLFETGSIEEAMASYRAALAAAQRVATADADNVQRQLNLATTELNLGLRGDDKPGRLTRAIAILRRLKAAGKLDPKQEQLLGAIEAMAATPDAR
jgi:tetratricopeptide (TPR) repeat protein